MAEKKIAECCGKLLSHTKAGAPYKHVCGTTVSVATDRTVQDVADRAGLLTAPPAEGVKQTEFPPAFWRTVREGLEAQSTDPNNWTTLAVQILADEWGVRISEMTASYVRGRLYDAATGASHEHSRNLDGSPCPCGTDPLRPAGPDWNAAYTYLLDQTTESTDWNLAMLQGFVENPAQARWLLISIRSWHTGEVRVSKETYAAIFAELPQDADTWTEEMVIATAAAHEVPIRESAAYWLENLRRDRERFLGFDIFGAYTREQLLEVLRPGLKEANLLASSAGSGDALGIFLNAGMKVDRATASAMITLLAAEEGHVHVYGRVHAPGEPQHGDMVCECGEKQPETMAAPAPVAPQVRKGPYFPARFPGLCETCGEGFGEGDKIRADGEGGYECEDHEDEEPETPAAPPAFVRPTFATVPRHDPEPVVEKPRLLDQLREQQKERAAMASVLAAGGTATAGQFSASDPWSAPAAVQAFGGETFALPAGMESLPPVNGQPDTKRDQWGRYLVKSPITGDFNRTARGKETGWTRATTLAKVLSDTFALENWAKRCVVAGMARKPELVATAQGLEVKRDSQKLDQIAEEAKELGGGSRGSKNGTLLHKLTERMDAGVWAPEGADLPEDVRGPVVAYREAMRRAGFTTRPEWIERITWTDLHGEPTGGTTDRILIGPDGRARIGDVKSAKSLDFDGQWMEIAIQMWLYAVGINQHGVYDLNTGTWDTSVPRVSTTEAIVMHMPIERPAGQPAYCNIYRVSLIGIDKVAAACARARAWRKVKGISSLFVGASPEWTSEFATAVSKRDLSRLYEQARAAGVPPQELGALVGVGQRRLAELGLS